MGTVIAGPSLDSPLLSDRFRSLPYVTWVRQGDATVLLDAERGRYYTLNEVGGRIWELAVAGEPVIGILQCLQDEYDAPSETLEADLTALLAQLVESGLIERLSL